MFCDQCGMEVAEGGAFCPNCGNRLNGDNVQAPEETEVRQEPGMSAEKEITEESVVSQGENTQRRFCPNCGTENGMWDTFCKECGMPLDGTAYSVSAAGQGRQMNQPHGAGVNKKKGLIIGICAAVAVLVLVLIVTAVRSLAMGPRGKVIQAVAATMGERPEIFDDIKTAGDILSGDQYTVGFAMEVDGDTVSGEYRNTAANKQIYLAADVDGDDFDVLCGIHSGVFKAAVSELDYVFAYDPKKENDGYLCEQLRKKELEQLNAMLEHITSEQASAKELRKDMMSALLQESEQLEFKEVKTKEFEVDGKDRECDGYRVRINEKNIANIMEYAGEAMAKRMPEELGDEFSDGLEELIDEIKDDDFDTDITFYLYKKKLAAVIIETNDYGEETWIIEFQGGDYRMQNVFISLQYDGDTYGEMEITTRKKGSVETIDFESDGDMTITYDTKSGALSLEYDDGWTDCFIEGIYKHSGSEVSFTLEEFEMDGYSLVEDEDVSFMIYVKKAVDIQKYDGTEFDLGSAKEDDFEELAEELEDTDALFDNLGYYGIYAPLFWYRGSSSAPAAPAAEEPIAEEEAEYVW